MIQLSSSTETTAQTLFQSLIVGRSRLLSTWTSAPWRPVHQRRATMSRVWPPCPSSAFLPFVILGGWRLGCPSLAFVPSFVLSFSILSPFVILGVFSSPLLFLEDKDCLPFFIGLKKFLLLLQRGARDMQKVVFRAASGGCHDPQYERRGSEEAHRPWIFGHFNPNLAIWPIEPPLPLNLYLPSSVIQNKTWRLRVALPALWLTIIQFEARRGRIKVETRSHFLFAQNFQGWQKVDLKIAM